MKHYDNTWIRKACANRSPYLVDRMTAFPGKIPTRIDIKFYWVGENRKKTVYFHYNGKRSNAALTRARRLDIRMRAAGTKFYTLLYEYSTNSVIYRGDLYYGAYYHEYSAFYLWYSVGNGFDRAGGVWNGAYSLKDHVIVPYKNWKFYVRSEDMPKLGDEAGLDMLRLQMADRYRIIRG